MTIACPKRHIAYSIWRYEVFRSLCVQIAPASRPQLSFLHPCAAERSSSTRQYAGSARSTCRSSHGSQSVRLVQRREFGASAASKDDPSPVESEPGNIRTAEKADKRKHANRKRKLHKLGQDEIDSPEYRQDLQASISALTDLVAHLKSRRDLDESQSFEAVSDNAGQKIEAPALPESPAFRKIKQTPKVRKQPPHVTQEPLRNDPWARMLAEPIRNCNTSNLKLPTSLLGEWSLTRNPKDDEVYLMPNQLADLEGLEQIRSRPERQHQKMVDKYGRKQEEVQYLDQHDGLDELAARPHLSQASINGEEDGAASVDRSAAPSAIPSKVPAMTRMLLYDNLVNLHSLKSLRSKASVAPRILPSSWREKSAEAHHFERNRAAFVAATGEEDATQPPVEATLKLQNVKWQKDIGERLKVILRKRVLVAFERVLKTAAAARKSEQAIVSTIEASKVVDVLRAKESKGARTRSEASDSPSQSDGATTSPQPTDNDDCSDYQPLSPRLFFHLGRNNSPIFSNLTHRTNNSKPMLPLLLPSLSPTSAQTFPLFPIRTMLGQSLFQDFLQIIGRYSLLPANVIETLYEENHDQIIMFQPGSKPGPQSEGFERLVREIWRLWRYGGGQRWLQGNALEQGQEWREMLKELEVANEKKTAQDG